MKKIISLLAACTLFAVCLPVSAADAVTEDSALLQNSVVEQTDPYTFYFVPERTYVSAEEVQAGDVHIPTKVYIKGNTQPISKLPVHAFAIRAIPAAFISPTAATFSAQRICTSNPTVAVLSSQNMRCRPASGKLPLPALTPLTAVHR